MVRTSHCRFARATALVVATLLVAPVAAVLAPTAAGAAPVTNTFSYAGAPVPIADSPGHPVPGAPATADVTAGGLVSPITDVDLRIDGSACNADAGSTTVGIDHTFVADLQITLTSPDATTVQVVAFLGGDNGSGANNFCQTVFDDEAASPFSGAAFADAPFTGAWSPNNPLSAFDGEDGNGTWTLSVQDFQATDTGNIRAFSVLVTTEPMTVTKTVTGDFEEGGTVTYEITATSNMGFESENDPLSDEIVDVVPEGLTIEDAAANSGDAQVNFATNTVTWNGAFPASSDGFVTLLITATVDEGIGPETLTNQATIRFDTNDEGTNDSFTVSDDPEVVGDEDPTSFDVPAIAPTVTIEQGLDLDPVGGLAPVPFDVVFSEPVTDFDADDVALDASTAPGPLTAAVVSGVDGDAEYTIEVSGMTGQGTVTASIPADGAEDAAGNLNEASTSADNSITVSRPPAAVNDSYTTGEDMPLEVSAFEGVLANDTDADTNAVLEALLIDAPTHGTLTLADDGGFDYDPDPNYQGPDSFAYAPDDGIFWSDVPAVVSIDVVSADDQPVAGDDAYAVGEDGVLSATAATGVLGNDTDPDDDTLAAVLTVAPTRGVLALAADGSFTYTPATNFTGTDAYAYVANDGGISSAPATVTITVAPAAGSDRNQYVDDAYQVLLGRHADQNGIDFWSGQLAGGMSRAVFTNAIEGSGEGIDTQIRRSYLTLLDRGADPAGVTAWHAFFVGGGTTRMLEAQLVGSAEFLTSAGGTNAGFVAEAYRELLGREADSAGATFWQSALAAGTTRTAVAQALLDSNEGVARQLAGIYALALNRAPDPAGVAFFAPVVRTGDRRFVLADLAASDEFFTLATIG